MIKAGLLYSCYRNNEGSPLNSASEMLTEIYSNLPDGAEICYSAVTGYGEELVKTAFSCDIGEVELWLISQPPSTFFRGWTLSLTSAGRTEVHTGARRGNPQRNAE